MPYSAPVRPESTPRAAVLLLGLVLVAVGAAVVVRGPAVDPALPPAGDVEIVAVSTTSTQSIPSAGAGDPEPTSTTTAAPVTTTVPTTTSTAAIATVDPSTCLTGDPGSPTGRLVTVPGFGVPSSSDPVRPYQVAVEDGLGADPECFAAMVESILGDSRSWGGRSGFAVQRVDDESADFVVALASPATTDSYCAPLRTNGIFSCWADGRAMVNVWRWEVGIAEYAEQMNEYRIYVINHEVGHALGYDHVECPAAGEPAPVMMQQTKGLDGCSVNGWPLPGE